AELDVWRDALADLTALALPTDRPRSPFHLYRAATAQRALAPAAAAALPQLAARWHLPESALAHALFHGLLRRHAGQDDIVTGLWLDDVLDAHAAEDAPPALGPTGDYRVVRSDFADAPHLRALATDLAGQLERARRLDRLAFDELVLQLRPTNDMSRTALFDVLMRYEIDDGARWVRFDDATATEIERSSHVGWGKFDLSLLLVRGGDADGAASTLEATLTYNGELFDGPTIDAMLVALERLLIAAAAPAHETTSVDALPLLDDAAVAAAIADALPSAAFPTDITLHGRFEAQAAAAPDRVALVDGDADAGAPRATLTYGALNARANRIAHALRAQGVGPDDRVGVFLDRSFDLIAAILGVLKAGGGYVPLDPGYPAARTHEMIDDAALRWVVTSSAYASALPASAHRLDVDGPDVADAPAAHEANPTPLAGPDHLAYIIYTSGSSGRPKGVQIAHRNAVSLLLDARLPFDVGPDDAWSLFHSPCFDFSVWEMYGALLFGGRLVIVPPLVARDARAFRRLLAATGVTMLSQTPTAFDALMQADADAAAGGGETADAGALAVRCVVFGGEALVPSKLQPWRARQPACRRVHKYGITETTVHVTWRDLSDADLAASRGVVGAQLATLAALVVDAQLRPVPDGVPGELLVGGFGVSARGYLDRPTLSAERFVTLPHDASGQRWYRSGDLGLRRPGDGCLIHLGRLDDQVKVRGFRIELGEIEARLLEHDAITEAVVLAPRDGATGEAQLVAYLVPALALGDADLDVDALQRFLGARLPDYMMPSRYRAVDRVPRTRNGKVDRARLLRTADVDARDLDRAAASDAPRPGLETAVAAIWAEVLALESVGRHDNFFLRGGHSLKANQAVARIRQRLGHDLSLKDFFRADDLAALARAVARSPRRTATAIAPAPDAPDHPVSFAQRRLWILAQLHPDLTAYNMVGAFHLDGPLDVDALRAAAADLVARHESLRTRFVGRGGVPRQRVEPADGAGCAFDVAAAVGDDEAEVALDAIFARELDHVFDLAAGPLLRFALLPLGAEGTQHRLVVNIHHIVCDGWSVPILMRELMAFYAARRDGRPGAVDLAPLPIQARDHATWQRATWDDGGFDRLRDFWHARFADGAPTLALPLDRPRGAQHDWQGAMHIAAPWPASTCAALDRLARQVDTTRFVALLALAQVLLHQRTGQRDLVIGTPIAGRERVELEGQIGFYLNLLALRQTLPAAAGEGDDATTFVAHLADAAEVAVDAFAHQDMPFDALVDGLDRDRDDGRHPLFDVLLILQNNAPLADRYGDLAIAALPERSHTSKCDLNLMVDERRDPDGGVALQLSIEYATALFDASTIAQLADDLGRLAARVAEDPSVTLTALRAHIAPATDDAAAAEEAAFLAAALAPQTAGDGWSGGDAGGWDASDDGGWDASGSGGWRASDDGGWNRVGSDDSGGDSDGEDG
ncbi:MAG: amino acid adenylation domain-containing protein, partial [Acidobacteriota bacterium]